jgi:transposase
LRCGRDKEPIKLVARETGLAPNTIRKYLRRAEPPTRQPRPRARLLDPYVSHHVDELIKSTPKITAARVGSYLREHVDA